jgi:hypothetical protein
MRVSITVPLGDHWLYATARLLAGIVKTCPGALTRGKIDRITQYVLAIRRS